jgi:two-component system, response regulator
MNAIAQPITILMAEDDPDDQLLTSEALQENRLANDLHVVADGVELLDFLYRRGKYTGQQTPRPGLILLDLNMPKMDGREALAVIKADPQLRSIPVVVLTTSQAEEDIQQSYDTGANSYISKPVTFEGLVHSMRTLGLYWFALVELPSREGDAPE